MHVLRHVAQVLEGLLASRAAEDAEVVGLLLQRCRQAAHVPDEAHLALAADVVAAERQGNVEVLRPLVQPAHGEALRGVGRGVERLHAVVVALLAVVARVVAHVNGPRAEGGQRVGAPALQLLPLALLAHAPPEDVVLHVGIAAHHPAHVHAVLVGVGRRVEVWLRGGRGVGALHLQRRAPLSDVGGPVDGAHLIVDILLVGVER